jgi:phage tail-like protein
MTGAAIESGLHHLTLGMAHRFSVKLMGYPLGNWSKASGLKVQWKALEHRPGDVVNGVWWYPGTTSYDQIKLGRAADPTNTKMTFGILQKISVRNTPQPGAIEMYDSQNQLVMSWTLDGAFPVAWEIEAFDAGASKVALETLTIQHNGFLLDETKIGTF